MKRTIAVDEAEYPPNLHQLYHPPEFLDLWGPPFAFSQRTLTVTGDAGCSHQGRLAAWEVGRQAAKAQTAVVTSDRPGIDRRALWGAWEGRGLAVVVFADPLPPRRWQLPHALLISPFLQQTQSAALRDFGRDEVCGALGEAVLVIRSACSDSPSIRVANAALELGRPVFVHCQGSGHHAACQGSQALVEMGAPVVDGYGQLAQCLGWQEGP